MMKRLAVIGSVVVLLGLGSAAQAAGKGAGLVRRPMTLETKIKRSIGSRPVVIGDLVPATDADVERLLSRTSDNARMLATCVEVAGDVVHWARDGRTLELNEPWVDGTTEISTAYCADGLVFLGGMRQREEEEAGSWLFYRTGTPRSAWGPASIVNARFGLTELKAIDPVGKQLLFAAKSADGRETLLVAPFAVR